MKRWLIHLIVYLLILGFTFLPVFGLMTMTILADAFGCRVDEGSIHPCPAFGTDIGGTLYTLGMSGWLMLFTFPVGAIILAVYTLLAVGEWLYSRYRKKKLTAVS